MPTWLSREARAEWRRLVPELLKLGILARIDRAVLATYCETWADYFAAVKAVRKDGKWYTSNSGAKHQHPMVQVLAESRATLLRFAQEFGLTPSARARIKVAEPKEADADPFADLGTKVG